MNGESMGRLGALKAAVRRSVAPEGPWEWEGVPRGAGVRSGVWKTRRRLARSAISSNWKLASREWIERNQKNG